MADYATVLVIDTRTRVCTRVRFSHRWGKRAVSGKWVLPADLTAEEIELLRRDVLVFDPVDETEPPEAA